MIHLFPRWVWFGAFLTTFSAGSLNIVAIITFSGGSVSHLTGTLSRLGQNIATLNFENFSTFFGMLSFFFIGSVISGFFIRSEALRLRRRYSTVLLAESGILVISYFLLITHNQAGEFLASLACGLQNAMISNFSGSIIRTTHMSGIFTDLGAAIGRALRTHQPQTPQIMVHLVLLTGFVSGSVVGTLLYNGFGLDAFWLPISITAICGILYGIHALKKSRDMHLPEEI